MGKMGLLFVISETPAAFENEFNAWYDTEHVPERLAIPGFVSGLRYVSAAQPRRYLAIYDTENVEVLASPEYQAFAGENFTFWTKRVLARIRVVRLVGRQAVPGDQATNASSCLLALRFGGLGVDVADELAKVVASSLGVVVDRPQIRVFEITEPEPGGLLVTVAGAGDRRLDAASLGDFAAALSMRESFQPYPY